MLKKFKVSKTMILKILKNEQIKDKTNKRL